MVVGTTARILEGAGVEEGLFCKDSVVGVFAGALLADGVVDPHLAAYHAVREFHGGEALGVAAFKPGSGDGVVVPHDGVGALLCVYGPRHGQL